MSVLVNLLDRLACWLIKHLYCVNKWSKCYGHDYVWDCKNPNKDYAPRYCSYCNEPYDKQVADKQFEEKKRRHELEKEMKRMNKEFDRIYRDDR